MKKAVFWSVGGKNWFEDNLDDSLHRYINKVHMGTFRQKSRIWALGHRSWAFGLRSGPAFSLRSLRVSKEVTCLQNPLLLQFASLARFFPQRRDGWRTRLFNSHGVWGWELKGALLRCLSFEDGDGTRPLCRAQPTSGIEYIKEQLFDVDLIKLRFYKCVNRFNNSTKTQDFFTRPRPKRFLSGASDRIFLAWSSVSLEGSFSSGTLAFFLPSVTYGP